MSVQRLKIGDSMGCGMNSDNNSRKVYFTRNGSTVTEICFGDDTKELYPAIGLQSASEETTVFIADLNSSDLWQAKNTLQQTVSPQSTADTQLPSGTSAETSDVMEKIQKELQCPICWNRLSEPKLLPCCQHTFCLKCISSYFQGCTNGQASCPVCRKSFLLPRCGATALENNAIANRLLDITKSC